MIPGARAWHLDDGTRGKGFPVLRRHQPNGELATTGAHEVVVY